jgi:hypothetical protein
MNRMATKEQYERLCVGLCANAIVAQRGNHDTLCRNRGDGRTDKFMKGQFMSLHSFSCGTAARFLFQ